MVRASGRHGTKMEKGKVDFAANGAISICGKKARRTIREAYHLDKVENKYRTSLPSAI